MFKLNSKLILGAILGGAVILSATTDGFAEKKIPEKTQDAEFLFVQTATAGSFDGKTLTLNNVPTTNYFSDRPNRITGHTKTVSFVNDWGKGDDSFKQNPPNATISIFTKDGVKDAVVVLTTPKLEGKTIQYQAKVLEGKLPPKFDAASLFIDGNAGAFFGGMAAGHVLRNVRQNTVARENAQAGISNNPCVR